jgi:hypothetical protein
MYLDFVLPEWVMPDESMQGHYKSSPIDIINLFDGLSRRAQLQTLRQCASACRLYWFLLPFAEPLFSLPISGLSIPRLSPNADLSIPMLEHPTSEIGLPVLAAICRRSVFPASYSLVEFLQTVRAGVVSHIQVRHSLFTLATISLLKLKPCDWSGFSPLSGAMGGSQRDGSARGKRR